MQKAIDITARSRPVYGCGKAVFGRRTAIRRNIVVIVKNILPKTLENGIYNLL